MRRPIRSAWLALLLAALSLAAEGAAADVNRLMQEFGVTPTGFKPAPAFSLFILDGKTVRLAEQRGRPVLLYFWATW
jgi:hypothetical protein